MRANTIEPLEPGTWLLQLSKLAESARAAEADFATSLRRAFHLVQLAPRPLRNIIVCLVSEREFERLLETGAFLKATVALVGDRVSYRLTRAESDRTEAEVQCQDDQPSGYGVGSSAPLALFTAWLEWLLTLHQPEDDGPVWATCPDRRKSQAEQRPKLTEH